MRDEDTAETPSALAAAIERACRRSSRYWLHWHRPHDATLEHEIEIRIDVPVDVTDSITNLPHWRIAKAEPETGMLFLRRFQPLTRDAVRAMIADSVTLAYRYGGRFHSWTHERGMLDWMDPGE